MKRLSFYNLKDVRKCTEITLSVIGLSGLDKQMKSYSPGKSCLCCRLVRPYYDDYSSDHYSSYSYSEFSGSNVLNDEHFLYWGPIAFQLFKNETSNKTVDFIVQIIEQTEFFDEVTCKPLSNGVLTPYEDRALSVRIDSKSKIAYFSRDQVLSSPAVEVIKMPSTLHIYGFIIAYDVSVGVDTYNGIKQLQFLSSVLIRQNKIKKPTVIVLTKCDNAVLKSINHLYKWMNNNKFNNIIIETSAQYNVNVENIINYFLCHYYEQSNNFRNKQIKFKNFTYVDAFRQNNNRNIESTTAYVRLIRSYVVSYKMEFLQFLMNFTAEHLRIYELYTKFFGVQSASTLFDLHTKHLRHHFEDRLLNSHLNRLENAFEYFLPDISSIELNFWQWEKVREYIISDPRLIEKFRDISIAWNSDEEIEAFIKRQDLINCDYEKDLKTIVEPTEIISHLIPVTVLFLDAAKSVYEKHVKKLLQHSKQTLVYKELYNMLTKLAADGRLIPGFNWNDVLSNMTQMELHGHFFNCLPEEKRLECFKKVMSNTLNNAREQFIELLFENSCLLFEELVNSYTFQLCINMDKIFKLISNDPRFKVFIKVPFHRQTLFLNHMAIFNDPDLCPLPVHKCVERSFTNFIESCNIGEIAYNDSVEDESMLLLILSTKQEFLNINNIIKMSSSSFNNTDYLFNGVIYSLNIKHVNYELEATLPDSTDSIEAAKSLIQKLVHFHSSSLIGVLVVISNENSLCNIETILIGISDLFFDQRISLVFLFSKDISPSLMKINSQNSSIYTTMEKDSLNEVALSMNFVKFHENCLTMLEKFQNARVFDFPIFQEHYEESLPSSSIHHLQLEDAVRSIINNKTCQIDKSSSISNVSVLRILVCSMCGDDIPIEFIISSLTIGNHLKFRQKKCSKDILNGHFHADLRILSTDSLIKDPSLTTKDYSNLNVDEKKNTDDFVVSFTFTSYHRAFNLINIQSYHGVVLNYLVSRKSSIEVANFFIKMLPPIPVHLVALSGYSSSVSIVSQTTMISSEYQINDIFKSNLFSKTTSNFSLYEQGKKLNNFYKKIVQNHLKSEYYFTLQFIYYGFQPKSSYSTNETTNSNQNNISQQLTSTNIEKIELLKNQRPVNIIFSEIKSDSSSLKNSYNFPHSLGDNNSSTRPLSLVDKTTIEKQYNSLLHSSRLKSKSIETLNKSVSNISFTCEKLKNEPTIQCHIGNPICDNKMSTIFSDKLKKKFISPPVWSLSDSMNTWHIIGDLFGIKSSKTTNRSNSPINLRNNSFKDALIGIPMFYAADNSVAPTSSQYASSPNSMDEKKKRKRDSFRISLTGRLDPSKFSFKSYKSSSNHKIKNRVEEWSKDNYHNDVLDPDRMRKISTVSSSDSQVPSVRKLKIEIKKIISFKKFLKNSTILKNNADPQREEECTTKLNLETQTRNSVGNVPKSQDSKKMESNMKISNLKTKSVNSSARNSPVLVCSIMENVSENFSKSPIDKFQFLSTAENLKSAIFNKLTLKINQPKNIYQSMTVDSLISTDNHLHKNDINHSYQDKITNWEKSKNQQRFIDTNRPNAYFGTDLNYVISLNLPNVINKNEMIIHNDNNEEKIQVSTENPSIKNITSSINRRHSLSVPSIVKKCVEYIEANGLEIEGIYRQNGNKNDMDQCMKIFESNNQIDLGTLGMSVHVFSGILKLFFTMLPHPLIPIQLFDSLLEAIVDPDANRRIELIKDIIKQFPPRNYQTLEYLLRHLSIVACNSKTNKMNSRCLAICFWPTIIRPPISSISGLSNYNVNACLLLTTCIEQVNLIFNELN